jgi:hypothetical protein
MRVPGTAAHRRDLIRESYVEAGYALSTVTDVTLAPVRWSRWGGDSQDVGSKSLRRRDGSISGSRVSSCTSMPRDCTMAWLAVAMAFSRASIFLRSCLIKSSALASRVGIAKSPMLTEMHRRENKFPGSARFRVVAIFR